MHEVPPAERLRIGHSQVLVREGGLDGLPVAEHDDANVRATARELVQCEQAERDGRELGDEFDPVAEFLHDVPPDIVAESVHHVREQSGTPFEKPWPLDAWPDVSTRFLLCRDDRFFPADFQRRVVRERLGITPDEMEGGHLPALSRPQDLARRLDGYLAASSP